VSRALGQLLLAGTLSLVAGLACASGKVLHRSGTQDPATLDPHRFAFPGEVQIVSDLFLGLLTLDPEAKPMAGAAESWTVSADGLTWDLRLREGLTWSDGRALTAADYEWSFRRMLDPATAFPFAARLYAIRNARKVNTGELPIAELGVKALDARRIRIELAHPAPYFPEVLATYSSPAPRHLVEARPNDWFRAGVMVTNGPFILEQWVPNSHVRLRKNPRFYDAANVALDAVVHVHPGDAASALRRFRAGELDVVLVVPPDQLDWARSNMPKELRLSPGFGLEHVAFNTRRPPFNDARVRRAASMAVDRDALARHITRAGETPAFGLVPLGASNYPKPVQAAFAGLAQAERAKQARALLAEAGYTPANPLKFTLTYPSGDINRRVAVALAAMWQAIGVRAELRALELKALVGEVGRGEFDAVRFQWLAGTTDPVSFLERLESGAGALNQSGYANARYDALVREAEQTADIARRAALLAQAEALALAEHPVAPLYFYAGRRLVSTRVAGWVENVRGVHVSRWLDLRN
jgi:oligopeptide transport system substrate-binding protein